MSEGTPLEPARGQSRATVIDGDDIGAFDLPAGVVEADRDEQAHASRVNLETFVKVAQDKPALESAIRESMSEWDPDYWTPERLANLDPVDDALAAEVAAEKPET